ncbi:Ras family protein [Pelomyxa schiedti]|nr:Ras family protein [Pelomyxa schiedti]
MFHRFFGLGSTTTTLEPIEPGRCETSHEIIVLGDAGVGKSAITLKFLTHSVPTEYDPTIEDHYVKSGFVIDGRTCTLEFLDTCCGHDEFTSMLEPSIRRHNAFLIIIATNSLSTFTFVDSLVSQILRLKEKTDLSSLAVVLCGNKVDLVEERVVKSEQLAELAHKLNVPYIETSAITGQNVNEAIDLLVREIHKREACKKQKL